MISTSYQTSCLPCYVLAGSRNLIAPWGGLTSFSNSFSVICVCLSDKRIRQQELPQFSEDHRRDLSHEWAWYGYVGFLLSAVRYATCGDPRDMTFAIVDLANRVAPDGHAMVPDYTLLIQSIYIRVSADVILGRPGLVILYHRKDVQKTCIKHKCSLPSWVPDFAFEEMRDVYNIHMYNAIGCLAWSEYPPSTVCSSILTVTGVSFDRVCHVSGMGKLNFDSFFKIRRLFCEKFQHRQ